MPEKVAENSGIEAKVKVKGSDLSMPVLLQEFPHKLWASLGGKRLKSETETLKLSEGLKLSGEAEKVSGSAWLELE